MKYIISIVLLFSVLVVHGQNSKALSTDFNTIYICIDSVSYSKLFQNRYLKDTLSICREQSTNTNSDSYIGKYLIGESATIEFFKPKKSTQIGDHFGDWGVEFKTRQHKTLNNIINISRQNKILIDTTTTKVSLDSLPIPWYKSLAIKSLISELVIQEYQPEYLDGLGFTKQEISQPMLYKDFNRFLSQGKKYPRLFSMVNYIKIYLNSEQLLQLKQFAKLNGLKQNTNRFFNSETTIEYELVKKLPSFPVKEIGMALLNSQKTVSISLSDNLWIKVEGKQANFIFDYK